jgi:pilus assembly protein Flp/PilA
MTNFFNRFAQDESGATAIEYGLIAALIAVALITVLGTLSGSLKNTFTTIAGKLDDANTKAN